MTDLVIRREVSNLVKLFGDALVRLGIREDAGDPIAELDSLVRVPWMAYRADPRYASPLTESGAPFEISLQVDGSGDPVLRYVIDTADQRQSLAANLGAYLETSRRTTGASVADLRELFDCNLDGVPAGEPARVMHGIGLARRDRRRASLYFPTSWQTRDGLMARLRVQASAASHAHAVANLPLERIEVIGYDFVAGSVVRWKTYTWLPLLDDGSFAPLADAYPGVDAAKPVYDAFVSNVPAHQHDRSMFLQLAGDGSAVGAKVFFFGRPWGWRSAGMDRLIGVLEETLQVDLQPAVDLRDAGVRRHLPLMLGLVAIGGDRLRKSVTFYYWPAS